ncbi:MAG: hypothetical protein KatS3mg076_1639 [Candidatus Binatia bacterium]|nr:MAG: hypothetical protein KatS3mg076_1639 [Candidatus Binatia bacterium]
MPHRRPEVVRQLFLANLGLQAFDAVATYHGVRLGFGEANPLLRAVFEQVGLLWGLLSAKAVAGGLLLLLYRLRAHRAVVPALAFLAAAYFLLSFVPWTARLTLGVP